MSGRLLFAAAVVSAAVAVLLASGYVGFFGIDVLRWHPGGPQPLYFEADLALDDGRTRLLWTTATASPVAPWIKGPPAAGWHLRWRGDFRLRLDPRRALWDADVHTMYRTPTLRTFILAAPIWCFEWPWLICPLLWLWARRRRRPAPTGFPVVVER